MAASSALIASVVLAIKSVSSAQSKSGIRAAALPHGHRTMGMVVCSAAGPLARDMSNAHMQSLAPRIKIRCSGRMHSPAQPHIAEASPH